MEIFKKLTVVLLLFLVFSLPFFSARNFGPAFDEITHLPSGYSYLKTGEINLNPQHPPLIKMIAALPLFFLDLKFDFDDPNLTGHEMNEWQFGRNFLSSNGIDNLIFWGRLPIMLLSVLLGWYIFKWGREMFGYKAGFIGLFIYAFMPNIIAHSQFITMDLGVAAFSFIALYYLWKLTKDPSRKNIILSGLTLGLALGSKFSAVLLLPTSLFLIIVYIHKKHQRSSWQFKSLLSFKILLPIWILSFLVIWGLYLFPKDPLFYWQGVNTVYADRNPDHFFYLNGNFNHDGWWYYFLWAFIIKTPVPFLIALGLSFFYRKNIKLNSLKSYFLFLPVFLFLAVTSWKGHNIGVRYILPVYPFLILFVSGWISGIIWNNKDERSKQFEHSEAIDMEKSPVNSNGFKNGRSFRVWILSFLFLILAGWYSYSTLSIYPDYLAYFNELVGGSKNGYKYLDDSNIEWGHDLKRLAEYQDKNPESKVLLWANSSVYQYYGVKNVVSLNDKNQWLNPEGEYVVSIHVVARTKLLEQVYGDNSFNWAERYKPIGKIGQSFFIYKFP